MSGRDVGSALVEALVAAAIVAAVLGVTMETASSAAARRGGLEQRRTALMVARSELAAVGAEIPVMPGEMDGVEGDFSWRVRIDPAQADGTVISRAGSADLVTVSVRSARGGPDLAVLKSLRLAVAP